MSRIEKKVRKKNSLSSKPERKPKLLAILGPTASGKSELAVYLAKKFNGEVISADSRQIYKDMDIGTGKITKKEMQGIPHYCLSIVSPKKQYNVAWFNKRAQKAINKILKKGKLPIVCGGTHFWIQVVVDGLQIPDVRPNKQLRKKLEKERIETLYQLLQKIDPKRAENIEPKNKRRIIRSLEIAILSKNKIPPKKFQKKFDYLKIAIKTTPKELKKKIEKRFEKRLKEGLIREVAKLKKSGLSWKRLESFGLEYKWVSLYLQNKIDLPTMKEKLLRDIWRLARKQISWLKNKEKNIVWVRNKKEAQKIVKEWLKN